MFELSLACLLVTLPDPRWYAAVTLSYSGPRQLHLFHSVTLLFFAWVQHELSLRAVFSRHSLTVNNYLSIES